MIGRIPEIEKHKDKYFRRAMFLCDEYQAFATVGEAIRPAMKSPSPSPARRSVSRWWRLRASPPPFHLDRGVLEDIAPNVPDENLPGALGRVQYQDGIELCGKEEHFKWP